MRACLRDQTRFAESAPVPRVLWTQPESEKRTGVQPFAAVQGEKADFGAASASLPV